MARKKNQGSKWIRPLKRRAVYRRDNCKCLVCGVTESTLLERGETLTLDHWVACELLERPDNRPENLVTMCLSCNSSKQDKTIRQWCKVLRERGLDAADICKRSRQQRRKDWRSHLAAIKRGE